MIRKLSSGVPAGTSGRPQLADLSGDPFERFLAEMPQASPSTGPVSNQEVEIAREKTSALLEPQAPHVSDSPENSTPTASGEQIEKKPISNVSRARQKTADVLAPKPRVKFKRGKPAPAEVNIEPISLPNAPMLKVGPDRLQQGPEAVQPDEERRARRNLLDALKAGNFVIALQLKGRYKRIDFRAEVQRAVHSALMNANPDLAQKILENFERAYDASFLHHLKNRYNFDFLKKDLTVVG